MEGRPEHRYPHIRSSPTAPTGERAGSLKETRKGPWREMSYTVQGWELGGGQCAPGRRGSRVADQTGAAGVHWYELRRAVRAETAPETSGGQGLRKGEWEAVPSLLSRYRASV